ncbi:hypothetical protein SCALM49S_04564 [Streptomyces californicus]
MKRRYQRPTYSFFSEATWFICRDGLSSKLKCQLRRFSSPARSRYSFFSQCPGLSGFVVPISFAPLTDSRPRSWPKKSFGRSDTSSQ